MIFKTAAAWIFSRFGIKGPEVIVVVVIIMAIGVFAGTMQYIDNLKRDRVLAEEAIKAAEKLYRTERQRAEVDTTAVVAWLEKRDEYRRSQQRVVDTTFTKFFRFPNPLDDVTYSTIVTQETTSSQEEEEPYVPPTSRSTRLSSTQRSAVSDGLWDSYCLAMGGQDADC